MNFNPPSDEEILSAVNEVFEHVRSCHPTDPLSALVVTDKHMRPDHIAINCVVDSEMEEMCNFTNVFNKHRNRTKDRFQQARIKILIYCHIMEADMPLTVIWNLLRILEGEDCDWTFHMITKKGNINVCEYTSQKLLQIKLCSDTHNLKIGTVLDRLWQSKLRNAFSHSQYCWIGDTFTVTKSLSPLSRNHDAQQDNASFTLDDIHRLYQGARRFLFSFIDAYQTSIALFKDGNDHSTNSGSIFWDTNTGWHWRQNGTATQQQF